MPFGWAGYCGRHFDPRGGHPVDPGRPSRERRKNRDARRARRHNRKK